MTETWRHKKRGSEYTIVGKAELQSAYDITEGDVLVIYRSTDGTLWARPKDEFHDGRFERVDKPSASEKLDAKFYGEIRKVKDDSIVPDDEYVVFLAKDDAFAKYALPYYLSACVTLGADQEQIDAVKRMIQRVNAWRQANRDRLKVPDAKGEKLLDQG